MRKRNRRKHGYVLVMCLLVVAVSSSIVLTLFNILRLQTAESLARRQMVVASSLIDAGHEHALAILIDQPAFRGTIGPVAAPSQPSHSYLTEIVDVSGDMQINVTSRAGATVQTQSLLITATALDDRRSALGL